jgi:Arc/MetJ-type ribon-helix-helix transcriptional regulator
VKSINVDLPEKIADELTRLVKTGWFHDEGEAVRVALVEFLGHRAAELQERFQHEDIEWALREKQNAPRRSASYAIPAP